MRRTPMPPPSKPMRRTRLAPVSARRRRRDATYPAARRYVEVRSRGACEARIHADDCNGRLEQVHHIRGRGGPDPHRLDNLVGLSRACHDQAHARPEWARKVGLMVSRHGGPA